MRKCVAAMLMCILVVGLLATGESAGAAPPKIKIGHDTTRITAPLKPDGTPDYIAALNKQYSRGVTPQNNAVVLILQALGPKAVIGEKVRAATLKAIRYKPPAEKAYFTRHPGGVADAYVSATTGPWRRADLPAIARWLDKNKVPLDLLVAASKRSRFFMPVLTDSEKPFWGLEILDQLSWRRLTQGAELLIARANLAAGEGRIEQAWQDILTVHRLGVLMGQDSSLVVHLVGVALGRMAGRATDRLATSGRLTAAQAKAILADMKALGPLPDIVTAIDQGERYGTLDLLIWFQKDPVRAFSAVGMPPPTDKVREVLGLGQVDYNDILRRANVYFDTLAAAMRKESFAERQSAYANIKERIHNLNVQVGIVAEKKLRPPFETPFTAREAGSALLGQLLPTLHRAKEIADTARVRRDLAVVAVALAAHRAEQGSYPGQLSALAPKYLKVVPDDFCGGKPFIYKRVGKGYLLYSVGENMRDDGGEEAKPEKDDIAAKAER